jgi:hypothetical protein
MPRRLEDVSHLFLGDTRPVATVTGVAKGPEPPLPRSRTLTVYLASQSDHVAAAMVVAGSAGMLARGGRRVLVGQTHEQLFGLVFGLSGYRGGDQAEPFVKSDVGPWVSRAPLIGRGRPGVFRDRGLRCRWDARAAEMDVVMVHVNADGDWSWTSGAPPPDELVLLAGDASYEALIQSYRAVKWAVAHNPDVCIRLVVLTPDDTENARWLKVVQAVDTFVGKPCPVIGAIQHVTDLAGSFLAGRLWDEGDDRVSRLVSPLLGRWETVSAWPNGSRRIQAVSAPSADAAVLGAVGPPR